MNLRTLIAVCILQLPLTVHSADIYRWIDDKGQTQISDSVPDKYKQSAQRIDSRQFDVTQADRKRAIAERERLIRSASSAPKSEAPPQAGSLSSSASSPKGASTDCAALLQRYRESQECFAPFRQANGSLREEAFQRCENIADPTPTCGPPDWK